MHARAPKQLRACGVAGGNVARVDDPRAAVALVPATRASVNTATRLQRRGDGLAPGLKGGVHDDASHLRRGPRCIARTDIQITITII